MKELTSNQFLLWEECGGLEITDFKQFLLWDSCGGLEITDF